MPYVSEDIFTGLDTIMKGGKISHIEYHEVGKARDVDLYTTTKFLRKISMGASQLACSRYSQQSQSSMSVGYFQGLSLYYSTVGFYMNHMMLYLSIWFTLMSYLVLVIVQSYVYNQNVTDFLTTRVFGFQIALTLAAPGVFQLILEYGIIRGLWQYITRFFILAIYSTFHILNISSYWQWGMTRSAFYLPSGTV
jgi:callose synthase